MGESAGTFASMTETSFWRENHICTLTTLRHDGTPHVVPVGVTYEAEEGVARIITGRGTRKVAHVLAGATRVAVCQVDRARWATLEGRAAVRTEPDAIADAVARYAVRYGRTPAPNPERVLIEITVDRTLGNAQ
jgi:PPOX class probable F420-dependent enzyme